MAEPNGNEHASGQSASPAASSHPAASSSADEASDANGSAPSAPSEPSAATDSSAAAVVLPAVSVKNIGMHIGGGPNDSVSKKPIGDSVTPHFDALRACWVRVEDKSKPGDFGVDLLIPRDGGLAKVSHPRTALKGDGFEECVVAVFAGIDFIKPKTGLTMVSYSVRFTP
ncbi:MAG: hypothetical protein FWD57_11040 [Polyangiaceae bacterium]|nr:hypothetical protein [Polyangiaceae bacterium]